MTNLGLPLPDPDALAHSEKVVAMVCDNIVANGPMTFSEYMNTALYAPGFGYYMVGNSKFGETGDFTTAPETSALFGTCMAQQIAEVLQITGGDVLEFGAGTGKLARDILLALTKSNVLPGNYFILEPSAELATRQRALFRTELAPDIYGLITWLDCLPESFVGVMLANEVLDAMPVECFRTQENISDLMQLYVDIDENLSGSTDNNLLCQIFLPATEEVREAYGARLGGQSDHYEKGYSSELNLISKGWFKAVSNSLARGLLLLVDYGYPRSEYYLPERAGGSLRCYYRHHLHDNPLLYPGLQDITADVDFTFVAEAATEVDLELHGYTSQAQFLLSSGLTQHAQALLPTSDQERFLIAQEVKTLSLSSAMGERFQVMGFSRGCDLPLGGFETLDLSHRL